MTRRTGRATTAAATPRTRSRGLPRTSRRSAAAARTATVAPEVVEALAADDLVTSLAKRGRRPDDVAFWLEGIDETPETVTAGQLLERASAAARGLTRRGLGRGERVFLILPTSSDFVYLLWGALFASGTPVPAYPPLGLNQLETFATGLRRMIAAARPRFVIVPEGLRAVLAGEEDHTFAGVELLTPTDIWDAATSTDALAATPGGDDLALVQFSSGSTGDPRGVCLSHRNILANVRAFATRIAAGPDDVCVTWLPLYHDMGLIGTLMATLMAGVPLVLFPPTDFLRQPAFWLRVLGKYRGTIGVAPQFAYALCVRRVQPAALEGTDLSSVRVLLNGAEPIQANGVATFERHFRPLGLRSGVVTPCYGLAEGTLAATMTVPGSRLNIARPSNAAGPDGGGDDASAADIVSCGRPMDGTDVAIVGPDGAHLPEGSVGEIAIRGPSVCCGILHAGAVTPAVDAAGWLRTRDLGFLSEGELYVTGRLKDVIIIGGRNYYPQDLEAVAGELPMFRPGRIAAFGVTEPERATEVLVVVAETTAEDERTGAGSVAELRRQLLERFGVTPFDTVLLRKGQIPITTSGKIRRAQTRQEYQRNAFSEIVYRLRPAGAARVTPAVG